MSQLLSPSATQFDIEKLRAGDVASFQLLYQEFYDEFLGAAEMLLHEKQEAPRIVNHCFIKAWLRCSEMSSINYVMGLLAYSLRNSCQATNNREGQRSRHHDNILRAVVSGWNLEKETRKHFLTEINKMSANQLSLTRHVFGKYYERCMTKEEIGADLGISPEQSQDCLDSAFKILHLILSKENL